MDELFAWCGFLGAWLLVAGPIYQASLELREEEMEREWLDELDRSVPPVQPVSPWWWLVPPAHVWLTRRRTAVRRDAMIEGLDDDEFASVMSFFNKATGWMIVGLGGTLLASKETYELAEIHEWPDWTVFAIVVVMFFLCVGHTLYRARQDLQAEQARTHPTTQPGT